MSRPIVVCVEGIIAAGKTTLIEGIKESLESEGKKVVVVPESVKKWEESGLLKLFYSNKSRYAYLFQTKVFIDKISNICLVYNTFKSYADVIILERSPMSDKMFMESMYDSGTIEEIEWLTYLEWADQWKLLLPVKLTNIIYLKVDIDESLERIKRRNREGEELITYDYQHNLQAVHDKKLSSSSFIVQSDDNSVPNAVCYIKGLVN